MKIYLVTILSLLLSSSLTWAQPSADASIGGGFIPSHIAPGENSVLTVNFAADAFVTLPTGEVEIAIELPANGAYINTTDPVVGPSGTAASSFNWFWNAATKTWAGINNQPILGALSGGGGTILIGVLGVSDPTQVQTILEVNYSNDSDDLNDHATPDLIVPVELSVFVIKSTDCGKVALAWATESEIDSDHFEIQRKIDSGAFSTVGEVAGAGGSGSHIDYQYIDHFELKGNHSIYYRLKQVDRDGVPEYSGEIVTNYGCREPLSMSLYPNPAIDIVNLAFSSGVEDNDISLEIYNNAGKVVKYLQNVKIDENNTMELDIKSLPEGMYRIKLTDGIDVINKSLIKIK